jgi:hypothetical protein
MSKLIYVDRLKKDILALQDCYNGFSDTYDKACIIGVIDEQPTIEERKKGKWIWDDEGYHCSECFFHAYGNTLECYEGLYHYCPNCGSEMRGESDGEVEDK